MEAQALTQSQIDGFVQGVQALVEKNYGPDYCLRHEITAQGGPKNVKIVTSEFSRKDGSLVGRSVHCFLRREDGAILKSASWQTPANGARGNVNTPTFGVEFVGPYGAAYLR